MMKIYEDVVKYLQYDKLTNNTFTISTYIRQHKPSPFMNSFLNKYVLFWYTFATSMTTLLSSKIVQ